MLCVNLVEMGLVVLREDFLNFVHVYIDRQTDKTRQTDDGPQAIRKLRKLKTRRILQRWDTIEKHISSVI